MPPKKTTRAAAKKTTAAASSAAKKAPAKPRAKASKATASSTAATTPPSDFSIAGQKVLLSPPFVGLHLANKLKATIKKCGGSVTTSPNVAQVVLAHKATDVLSDPGKAAVQAGAVRVSVQDFYKAVGRWGKETGLRPGVDTAHHVFTKQELEFLSWSSGLKCTEENTKSALAVGGVHVVGYTGNTGDADPAIIGVFYNRGNGMIRSKLPPPGR